MLCKKVESLFLHKRKREEANMQEFSVVGCGLKYMLRYIPIAHKRITNEIYTRNLEQKKTRQ